MIDRFESDTAGQWFRSCPDRHGRVAVTRTAKRYHNGEFPNNRRREKSHAEYPTNFPPAGRLYPD